jgi:hypothetical protein
MTMLGNGSTYLIRLQQLDPPLKGKVKTTTNSELANGKYMIWNLLGSVPRGASSLHELMDEALG